MNKLKIHLSIFIMLVLTVSCASPAPPLMTAVLPSPTPPPSGMPPTIQPTPIFTPTFNPPSEKSLTICTNRDWSLYPSYVYFDDSGAQKEFLNAITPPPIALGRDNQYTPTILEKLPSLEDGDARLESVTVTEGDLIVDDAGEAVTLEAGTLYQPSGCRESACAETYAGGEVQMDRLSADFRLLESVRWSNGHPLNAYDSTFAYEVITDPDFFGYCLGIYSECGLPEGADRGVLERTADYLALDEYTVRWVGLPGYITPRYFLNFFSPMPRHLLEGIRVSEIERYLRGLQGTNFVGWGPYKVKEWVDEEYLHMERNPNYFGVQDGLPRVDFLWWRYISNSEGSALEAMLRGKCSIASAITTNLETKNKGLIPFQEVLDNDEIETYIKPAYWDGLVFNIEASGRFAFFEDAGVRQAVALGTDRAAIAQAMVGDRSLVRESYLPPQHYLYAGDTLSAYPFSPERASQLLTESGWVDRDGDGILEKGGQPFVVKLITIPPESRQSGLEIFQQNMADLGIQVEIEFQDYSTYFDETMPEKAFDLVWGDRSSYAWWLGGLIPDCVSYTSGANPTSDQLGYWREFLNVGDLWSFLNVMGYSNPEFDAACQTGITSLDPEEAREGHILAQQIFSQDLPILPLFSWPTVVLYRTEVVGLRVNSGGLLVNFELLDILDTR